MTAFVFDYSPERALITSETMASLMGATVHEFGFVEKCYSIPRLRLAICGRGPLQILINAYIALLGAVDLRDADEALERLPSILRGVTDAYADEAGIADWRSAALLEAYVFAWSPKRRRVVGFGAANYHKKYALQPIPEGVSTVPDLGVMRPKTNDPVQLMHVLQAAFSTGEADIKIGGEILQHGVSQRDMGLRVLGKFADFEAASKRATDGFAAYDPTKTVERGAIVSADHAREVTEAATNVVSIATAGMNRQQRKAAEAMARRAGKRR